MTGQTVDGGQHRACVAQFNAWGQEVHRDSFAVDGHGWGAALAPTSDGGHVVLGRSAGKGRYGGMQRRGANHKLQWAQSFEHSAQTRPLGLLAYLDGSFGVLLQPLAGAANTVCVRHLNDAGKSIWLSDPLDTGKTLAGRADRQRQEAMEQGPHAARR